LTSGGVVGLGDALRVGDRDFERADVGGLALIGQDLQDAVAVAVIDELRDRIRRCGGLRDGRQSILAVPGLGIEHTALAAGQPAASAAIRLSASISVACPRPPRSIPSAIHVLSQWLGETQRSHSQVTLVRWGPMPKPDLM
jgi:hypothetical protein